MKNLIPLIAAGLLLVGCAKNEIPSKLKFIDDYFAYRDRQVFPDALELNDKHSVVVYDLNQSKEVVEISEFFPLIIVPNTNSRDRMMDRLQRMPENSMNHRNELCCERGNRK